jgi:hypothetical protein
MVQQLFKVNKVRFSNPKRLLKPLIICLPFCFVCSAQVKGNLTFGTLTANNPMPRTGPSAAASATHSQGGGDILVVCRGSQKQTCVAATLNSQSPRAGLYVIHQPRAWPRRDQSICYMNAGTDCIFDWREHSTSVDMGPLPQPSMHTLCCLLCFHSVRV